MAYQAGSTCYATVGDAAKAQAWLNGHDTTIVSSGVAHLVQYVPEQWGDETQWVLHQKLFRLSDGVLAYEDFLGYNPPSCGTLDPAQFGITPPQIAKVIGWGFGVVLLGFFLGYVTSVAVGLIRKA